MAKNYGKLNEVEIDQSVVEEVLINQGGKYVKPTTKYTVMLIPDSTDKTKVFELPFDKIMRFFVGLAAAALIVVSLLLSSALKNYRREHDETDAIHIKKLEDTIIAMNANDEKLGEKIYELEGIIEEKEKREKALHELEMMEAIPNFTAIDGVAVIIRNTDENKKRNVYNAMAGTLILATGDGKVAEIGYDSEYGRYLRIDHQNGYITNYYTYAELRFAEGDAVRKGDAIAVITEDNQLIAYEIMKDNEYIDLFEAQKLGNE